MRLNVIAAAHLSSWVLNAAAGLLLVVALIIDRDSWLYVLAAGVVVASNVYALVIARRSVRTHQSLGAWTERAYVIDSLREAMERGLSPAEWIEGYQERVIFEGIASGVIKSPNDEPPDGSHEALP